jgi:gamma-glutamylaminecyclotransferase
VAKRSSIVNPHGLGIIWLDTFEVTYHKSSDYKALLTKRPYIAHFRYATVGKVGRDNTHPFQCGANKYEWLMMNGTIRELGNKNMSDSKALAIKLGSIPRHRWAKELEKHACRFVTINTRNKSFQVYNKNLWTIKDGVWFSKDNVLDGNLVAVYGTLKKGYSNYWHYLPWSEHVGAGKTKDKYPLVITGLPYLIDSKGVGHNVKVDVFSVSDYTLRELDKLEGHPNWYRRKQIPIVVGKETLSCWIYFNIKEEVSNRTMHEEYTQDTRWKPAKRWTSWQHDVVEEDIVIVDKAPKQSSFRFEDIEVDYNQDVLLDDTNEFDIENEKPLCPDCFHDVEHDFFANYHCCGCNSWFKEDEVLRFRP